MFGRVKPLEAILATAEARSLKRSLGAVQLTLLGVGAVIGTGIFVLTAQAAQTAGPGMMVSFIIAGFVCGVTALCYAELAAMVPVSGSAYTYTYAVVGELMAWMVGWALILEYAVAASAVSVGWSGFFVGLLHNSLGITVPAAFASGPYAGGIINLPALGIALLVTGLLIVGTSESARVNAVLVVIKVVALSAFIAITVPSAHEANFRPFVPNGWGTGGMLGAAASIFFAYVGFDAVSTAAEETKNPQRNLPIGLIGSLAICTIFYLLVAAGAIGTIGAQPVVDAAVHALAAGSSELTSRCVEIASAGSKPLVCSNEVLPDVLRLIGYGRVGDLVGLAAAMALPSVILMMLFGQTRIFFVMARDGLLPERFASIHPRWGTPHVVTAATGVFVAVAAAFFPVGQLANISNSGTLFAFAMVAVAVMILRRRDPDRARPFRTPAIKLIGPLAIAGCVGLYLSLPLLAQSVLVIWGAVGLLVYFLYGHRHSKVGQTLTSPVSGEPRSILHNPLDLDGSDN